MLLVAFGLFSCGDDGGTAPFSVIGDVIVIKRSVDGEMKYANSYYAWGTQPMQMAKVITPLGPEFNLDALSDKKNTYGKEPSLNEYSSSVPTEGNYMFLVMHEEISHEAVDLLTFDDIDTTAISSVTISNEIASVEWENNPDADNFVVRLTNTSGDLIFVSQTLSKEQRRLDFSPGAYGAWQEAPVVGVDYIVEVLCIKYEDITNADDLAYHIQEISVAQQNTTWE